jgi:hypothetical protein
LTAVQVRARSELAEPHKKTAPREESSGRAPIPNFHFACLFVLRLSACRLLLLLLLLLREVANPGLPAAAQAS